MMVQGAAVGVLLGRGPHPIMGQGAVAEVLPLGSVLQSGVKAGAGVPAEVEAPFRGITRGLNHAEVNLLVSEAFSREN